MNRFVELILCLVSLIILVPIMIALMALVFIEDRHSPILKQVRVGKGQVPFTCYKIRTMSVDTAEVASHEASANQITKIGGFLRKTGLDELPQIFNVLMGQMSFVGPRPNLPSQTALIAARDAHKVYDVSPGITGLAQVQGVDMSVPEKLALIDREYVQGRSFKLDCSIIWATIRGKGVGDAIKA